jgi:hypothetical protein
MEQSFKLRRLQDLLPDAKKEDIITIFMALQHQNFVLSNTVSNLVKQWPLPAPSAGLGSVASIKTTELDPTASNAQKSTT